MGLVSFLVYEVYQSLKTLTKEVSDIKIMIVEGQKDIYYLKEDHKEFKKITSDKITYLENEKHARRN
jgi:hypothetical protein